jgi:hypothetical protein
VDCGWKPQLSDHDDRHQKHDKDCQKESPSCASKRLSCYRADPCAGRDTSDGPQDPIGLVRVSDARGERPRGNAKPRHNQKHPPQRKLKRLAHRPIIPDRGQPEQGAVGGWMCETEMSVFEESAELYQIGRRVEFLKGSAKDHTSQRGQRHKREQSCQRKLRPSPATSLRASEYKTGDRQAGSRDRKVKKK